MFTDRNLARRSWLAPAQWLESFLFGAVQMIILAGTLLAAAQVLVTV